MDQGFPSIELIESTHSFPCEYVFKVIGQADDYFVGRVVSTVRAFVGEDHEPEFSSRETKGGRHVCVTIRPIMQEAQHVILIYEQLRVIDGLVMLM